MNTNDSVIPTSYEDWKDCIIRKCGIPLTEDFIRTRLKVYKDLKSEETLKFIHLYGKNHLDFVVRCLNQAMDDCKKG